MTMPNKPQQLPKKSRSLADVATTPQESVGQLPYLPAKQRYLTFGAGDPNLAKTPAALVVTPEVKAPVIQPPKKVEKPDFLADLPPRPSVKQEKLWVKEDRWIEDADENDDSRRYITPRTTDTFVSLAELEFPTTMHLAVDAESSEGYFPRKLTILKNRKLPLIASYQDPIGLKCWGLTQKGYDKIMHELPPITTSPHGINHAHRQNLNTLFVKLKIGVQEPILFPRSDDSMTKNTPLPILTKRWLNVTGERSLVYGNTMEELAKHKQRLLNDSNHPVERMSEFDIRKGALENETKQLLEMYKTQNSAFLFNLFDRVEDGDDMEVLPAYGVHGVVLRPLVAKSNRADGRMGNELSFNHDGLRIEVRERQQVSYYEYVLAHNYHSGLYGRLHIFSDLSNVWNMVEFAMKQLEQKKIVPMGTGANWLVIHKQLPASMNHKGEGNPEYDAFGNKAEGSPKPGAYGTKYDG